MAHKRGLVETKRLRARMRTKETLIQLNLKAWKC